VYNYNITKILINKEYNRGLKKIMGVSVLFVCTGNTCRSPMAEYYFNYKAREAGLDYQAVSRGLYAESGSQITANAKKVLLNNNIISNIGEILHESAQIDEKIISEADYIYGITENHAVILQQDYPDYAGKIFAMPEYIGDPYGRSLEVYEECFEKIKRCVDIILKELQNEKGN
jgi:protein-tyrosine-phosphatase